MKKCVLPILLILALLLGCGNEPAPTTDGSQAESLPGETTPPVSIDTSDLFTDRDQDPSYDESKCVHITLSQNTAACDSSAVTISEGEITITAEGTYVLKGTLDDGSVTIDVDKKDKVQLVLAGAAIHSEASAPIYIRQADKVFITSAQGTENALSNGGSFTPDGDVDIDSVIFSRDDLTLNGSGSLSLNSPAGHGIVSKDELTITGGTYTITTASHGIVGKDNVCIANGTMTIEAGKDGIHSENNDDEALGFIYIENGSFSINAGGDGISAQSLLEIPGGSFSIVSGGGSSNAPASSGSFGGFNPGGFGGQHGGMGGQPGGMGNPPEPPTGDPTQNMSEPPTGAGTPPEPPTGDPTQNMSEPPTGAGTPPEPPTGDPTQSMSEPPQNMSELPGGMGGDPFGNLNPQTDTESLKGIKCAGSIRISGGSFTIDSADDTLHSNTAITITGGSFQLSSGDDGIHADETLTISQGTITVDKCYEGLEALDVLVSGGDIKLYATDDGINAAGGTDSSGFGGMFGGDVFGGRGGHGGGMGGMSPGNGSIVISGGKLYISASGDGIDANGCLEISGGFITVCGPTRGDTATLDYDTTATISGGTFLGTGASGMAQSFSDSPQGVFAVSVGNQAAGTAITLTDASGKVLLSHAPELDFSVVIFSSPEIIKGESYTITVGETSGSFAAK